MHRLTRSLTNTTNPTSTVAERTLSFVYGPEHQRVRQDVKLTGNAPSHMEAGTTWYYNGADSQGLSYEKTVLANGTTEHKHYVNAAGVTFALYVKREGTLNGKPATSISYFHHDHLGSIAAVSNQVGAVVERMAYDPWGKRRLPNGTNDRLDALYGVSTDRGYTMHEHLDEMGIIHMNGRVFDPLIGRFMSADPFIPDANNLQAYNRYAYVYNNPLLYTDPDGFKPFWQKKWFRQAVSIAVAVYFGPAGAGMGTFAGGGAIFTSSFANAAFAGGLSGAVSTGTLKGALQGALMGSLMHGVGDIAPKGLGNVVGHAAVGCASSVAAGGQCGSGAAAGAVGSLFS